MLGGVATYFELQFYNENPIFKNFDLENKICEIQIYTAFEFWHYKFAERQLFLSVRETF